MNKYSELISKLDEKLTVMFEEFARLCKFKS